LSHSFESSLDSPQTALNPTLPRRRPNATTMLWPLPYERSGTALRGSDRWWSCSRRQKCLEGRPILLAFGSLGLCANFMAGTEVPAKTQNLLRNQNRSVKRIGSGCSDRCLCFSHRGCFFRRFEHTSVAV